MFQVRVDTAKGMHVGNFYITDKKCVIGKKADNDIVLHGWRLSSEHACLNALEDGIYIKNFSTKIGTRVNGTRIDEYGPISVDDVIEIHDYRIQVTNRNPTTAKTRAVKKDPDQEPRIHRENDLSDETMESSPQSASNEMQGVVAERNVPLEPSQAKPQVSGAYEPPIQPEASVIKKPAAEERVSRRVANEPQKALPEGAIEQSKELSKLAKDMHTWRLHLRKTLHEQMDLRRINVSTMSEDELRQLASSLTGKAIAEIKHQIPDHIDQEALLEQVVAEAVGLGPLEPLLARDDVSEIMVNSCQEVFFETGGKMYKSDVTFTDDQAVQATIERIVTPVGRRIDESSPMVDARLKDGSRVNAIIPPLALKGSCLTIRKFMKRRLGGDDLIAFGSVDQAIIDFLQVAVMHKRNILVSGGTGSGKTTLLNVLSNFIPDAERIVTIEDSAELQLYQPNLVQLEARPANQEGRGGVSIRDLVKNSLRMRPDRIVVGECRGSEALDMLQAMNTGHDGSLTTAHANSARDCISRLEVMVMMAGMDLPAIAIREQVASAVQLIVQQTRFSCGSRKITGISEIVGVENGRIQLAEVFRYNPTGYDENGRVTGHFTATGLVPEFYEGLKNRGVGLDLSIFEPREGVA